MSSDVEQVAIPMTARATPATGFSVPEFYRQRESLRRTVRELASRPGGLALDVGCKTGDISRPLATGVRFLAALDIERHPQWREATPGLAFLAASAMALPFRDAAFDLVVSSECLQYVPDPHAALRELARVLRPGGLLVVSFPEGSPANVYLDPYNLHYCALRLVGAERLPVEGFVRHLRAERMLRAAPPELECEVHRRSGTLGFILIACLIDQVEGVRLVARRRAPAVVSRLADAVLGRLLRLLFHGMNLDNSWSPPWLWYNNVIRFRKG